MVLDDFDFDLNYYESKKNCWLLMIVKMRVYDIMTFKFNECNFFGVK